ncbi:MULTISPECIES: calcium-binding protein [Cysteiniphilum]|uniref:Haemolysin-type calcium binding-related domain-containing protein n=1 Tax=Cysteiniphilum litorale TaxID=2056700 RepID=A0A8J2Z2D5_9GAMM|nr:MULTISPECIES: calcium-binding protein [Cysteiniphilum]GGF90320.1 hypothetical protein GCM10010995_04540 [Cysteiniphilum litorale]
MLERSTENENCDAKYSFSLYSDGLGGYDGYHTWIKLSNGTNTYTYSFGPLGDVSLGELLLPYAVLGHMSRHEPEGREQQSESYTGFISKQRYEMMKNMADFLASNPPDYQLYQYNGDNCVEVTSKILEAAGIKILKGILGPGRVIDEIDVLNARQNSAYQFYPEYQGDEEECDDEIDESINNDFNTAANVVPRRRDPLIFDLDGDGIETVAADGSVLFDHNGDGVKYASGWVGADDALLVRDLDQNGQIDNGLELFGDNTIKANGEKATDGFDALSDLDDNVDGVFDHNDTAFDELRLWQDSNQDGVVQDGELKSLDDAGILSVDLNATNDGGGATGGVIAKKSTYNTVNGESFVVAALDFNANLFYREYHDDFNHQFVDELEAIDLAFNIRGSGAVRDLNQAAVLNPEIVDVIQNIMQTNSYQQRIGLYQALVSAWAQSAEGFTSAITTLEGLVLDSGAKISFDISDETRQRLEKIVVLEAFNFSHMLDYVITENGVNSEIRISIGNWSNVMKFNSDEDLVLNDAMFMGFVQQVEFINKAYDKLLKSIDRSAFKSIDHQMFLDMIEFNLTDQGNVGLDFSHIYSYLNDRAKTDSTRVLHTIYAVYEYTPYFIDLGLDVISIYRQSLGEMAAYLPDGFLAESLQQIDMMLSDGNFMTNAQTLLGSNGNDRISVHGTQLILAGDGNDIVIRDRGTDDLGLPTVGGRYYIDGGKGHDKLYGNTYDDVLFGGDGNDYIDAGLGDDIIDGGKGDDYLYGGVHGNDTIFGGDGNDYIASGSSVYQFYYEDFHGYLGENIFPYWNMITGGKGDDVLASGYARDSVFIYHMGDGNDILVKNSWGSIRDNEIIWNYQKNLGDGLLYNKTLGADGVMLNDTFNDVIRFGESISVEDVSIRRIDYDLFLDVVDGGSIQVVGFYKEDDDYANLSKVSRIEFSDGTVWDRNNAIFNVEAQGVNYMGTESDEYISATIADDTLQGLGGNDALYGKQGNDILDGGQGDDHLEAGDGDDILIGGKDNDFLLGGLGHDRYIFGGDSGEDMIYYYHYADESFTDSSMTLVFEDGVQLQDLAINTWHKYLAGQWQAQDLKLASEDYNISISLDSYFYDFNDSTMGYSMPVYLEFNNGTERWQLMPHKAMSIEINGEDKSFHNSVTLTRFDEVAQMIHIKGIGRSEYLQGTEGNDILDGGGYHDYLAGGLGADHYVLSNLSFNDDVIIADETNTEDAVLLKDVSMDELYFLRDNDDLSIIAFNSDFEQASSYQNNGGFYRSSIKLSGYFKGLSVETIVDSEGNTHSIAELLKDENKYSAITDDVHRIGSKGNDYIESYAGDDVIHAKSGDNWIEAGAGNNTITAGSGDDRIHVDNGNNLIKAGSGDNVVEAGDGENTIITGSGADTIDVGQGDNVIKAGHGENSIQAGSGDNQIYGGADYDYVYVEDGNNLIKLGNGDNELDAGGGDNVIYAGSGDDSVSLGDGNNTVKLGNGDNQVYAYDGDNIIMTGGGDDYIELGDGNNIIRAGHGDNEIDVGDGDNQIYSGNGADVIYVYDGDNVIKAGHGENEIYAGNGNNIITTGNGDDLIEVQSGQNTIRSGAGDDTVYSGNGSDLIYAGKGDDVIYAGGGNDQLYAQWGDNILYGEDGNDSLYAGNDGADQLFGGQGDDTLRAKNGDDFLQGQDGDDLLIAHGDNNILSGGNGSDHYQINFKNANNTIINNYDSDGSSDFMKLNGIKTTDLRFYREVSNLMIKNLADKNKPKEIIVTDWFESGDHQIDEIEVGKFVLSNKQIDVIIQTLASFNVESGVGEDLLNKEQQDEIKSTLANAWMPKSA